MPPAAFRRLKRPPAVVLPSLVQKALILRSWVPFAALFAAGPSPAWSRPSPERSPAPGTPMVPAPRPHGRHVASLTAAAHAGLPSGARDFDMAPSPEPVPLQLCVWGAQAVVLSGANLVPALWTLLQRSLPRRVFSRITKIVGVRQADGLLRADLFFTSSEDLTAMQAYLPHSRIRQLHARPHISFHQRQAKARRLGYPTRIKPPVPLTPPSASAAILSYNIRSLSHKRDVLREYLATLARKSPGGGPDCILLQETNLSAAGWSLALAGYRTTAMSPKEESTPGAHGLLLMTKKDHTADLITTTPWYQIARVRLLGHQDPLYVVNVYLPHPPATRRATILSLQSSLQELVPPTSPLVISGDFNCSSDRACRLVPSLVPLATKSGYPLRYTRTVTNDDGWTQSSTIDHTFVSSSLVQGSYVKTLKRWDLSDHLPVLSTLLLPPVPVQVPESVYPAPTRRVPPPKFFLRSLDAPTQYTGSSPDQWSASFTSVVSSNSFAALEQYVLDAEAEDGVFVPPSHSTGVTECGSFQSSPESLDRLAMDWEKAVIDSFSDTQLCRKVRRFHLRARKLPRSLRRKLRRRRQLYRAIQKAAPGDRAQAQASWRLAADSTREEVQQVIQEEWRSRVNAIASDLKANPRRAWESLDHLARWRSKSSSSSEGLPGSAPEVIDRWTQHFTKLFSDVTGHSRDQSFWRDRFPTPASQSLPQLRDAMTSLNDPFTFDELLSVLQDLQTGKAPGFDGIPTEVYGILRHSAPACHMGRVLLTLLNKVYISGHIPQSWTASVLVPVFKKGDRSNPSNYRGIALMQSSLKLLCLMLNRRLSAAVEGLGLLTQHQAGFRPREEAVAQAITLLEILQRRSTAELDTWALFLDIKKAYDTVPHCALFEKLSAQFGLHGTALNFLQSLYDSSTVQVCVGRGAGACLSTPIPILRGLRQGCVLSPLLFNMFANDWFAGYQSVGVPVPGLDKSTFIPGLQFADDVVHLTASEADMATSVSRLEAWLEDNEMSLNIPKCALLRFGPSGPLVAPSTPVPVDSPSAWCSGGEPFPVATQYKYLGILITSDLSLESIVESRLASAEGTFRLIFRFLASRSVPIYFKMLLIKMVILPQLLYGSEICGGSVQRYASAQRFVNQCCRLALRGGSTTSSAGGFRQGRSSGGLPNTALWREFRIAPLHAYATARRLRLFSKSRLLQTYLGTLVRYTTGAGRRRWSLQSKSLATRHGHGPATLVQDPSEVYRSTLQSVWQSIDAADDGKRARQYFASVYPAESLLSTNVSMSNQALRAIILMRMDSWYSGSRLARYNLIAPNWSNQCPFCHQPGPEDVCHAVFDCAAWHDIRCELLHPLLSEVEPVVAEALSRSEEPFGSSSPSTLPLPRAGDPPVPLAGATVGASQSEPLLDSGELWLALRRQEILPRLRLRVLCGGQLDTVDSDTLGTRPVYESDRARRVLVRGFAMYLDAVLRKRSPILRRLIAVKSQSRNGRASHSPGTGPSTSESFT